ncbi:hypothetical protein FPC831_2010004 [Flavobacterium psychrophilum]|nr:hypothetical protein FPC831_2010004 [Flavobacterium psychrophilum]SNB96013.1 hypothetical protein FPC840_1870003 [Flavobacterium psychrophilum]GEJ31351.1 hypothetical protein FPN187_contig00001-0034 [Flavobacterium psychrophilum]GEJ31576.1 hypothetical protein FPN181_contig00057-0004 [Flavobacterium psychrophilum]GEJ39537.1 hypothetical protein FPN186_contig00027-0034 [Flavobacterium psychrophilum]
MKDYSILDIPTVLNSPIVLKDISFNCPVCDFEIEIDLILINENSIECENCEHITLIKIKNI